MKNGSLKAYFKTFLSVFDKKCVPLQCRAYAVPSEKDARMGGTLHNVKSVIDALSIGCLNLRNSNCVSRTMSEVNATGMQ